MAIIYSYPYVSTVNNSDTLVISVSDTTADNGFLTKSLTADNLASYVTARVNLNFLGDTGTGVVNLDTQNLSITGTANEIENSSKQSNSTNRTARQCNNNKQFNSWHQFNEWWRNTRRSTSK